MTFQPIAFVTPLPMNGDNTINPNTENSNGGLFDTLERIILTAEARSDLPPSFTGDSSNQRKIGTVTTFGGPLSTHELSRLSLICTSAMSSLSTGQVSSKYQGFATIDGDLLMNLVPLLDQHVESATRVDLVREAYNFVEAMKSSRNRGSEGSNTMTTDLWLHGASNLASFNGMGPGAARIMTVKNGLEAAAILLAIIVSPGVDRRVVSEDSIEGCMALLRQHLFKNVTPALTNTGHLLSTTSNACDKLTPTPKKRRLETGGSVEWDVQKELKKVYKHCVATIPQLLLLLERCEALISAVSLDDQPVLTLCSTVLNIFTIEPTCSQNDEGSYCHVLQVSAIGLVTVIFHRYPMHRHVVVEDLFPVLLNLPTTKKWMRSFPLPQTTSDGVRGLSKMPASRRLSFVDDKNSVQSFTILLLSLVQTCVVMPRFETPEEFQVANHTRVELGHKPRFTPELKSGLANCQEISDVFVLHLLQRCSKKGEEGGASEFRPVLQNLVDDLVKLQLVPEFPAAEMLLLSFCKLIGSQLHKASSASAGSKGSVNSQPVETTYLTTGFDVLGKICASIATVLLQHRVYPLSISRQKIENKNSRDEGNEVNNCLCGRSYSNDTFMVCCDNCHGWSHGDCVGLSKDTLGADWACDDCKLKKLAMNAIEEFSARRSTQRVVVESNDTQISEIMEIHVFRQLLITSLAGIGQQGYNIFFINSAREFLLASWIKELSIHPDVTNGGPDPKVLCGHFLELWNRAEHFQGENGTVQVLNKEGCARLMTALAATQSELVQSFPRQMGLLMGLMADDSASFRKYAVKALSLVLEADATLMLQPMVKQAVSRRFLDESKSVREAIVSLVGKFVVQTPEVANAFSTSLLPRLNDEGVSVRKKTVRICHEILTSNPTFRSRATACAAMLRRAADPKEDDSVRDLIHALFAGLWLGGEIAACPSISASSESGIGGEHSSRHSSREPINGDACVVTPNSKGSAAESDEVAPSNTRQPNIESSIQIRCRIASEQMIEVVAAANTKDVLSSLLRDLLFGLSDSDKDRKATERENRKQTAIAHCSHLVDALFENLLTLEEKRSLDPGLFAKRLVAVTRTIGVFSEVAPRDVLRHINTLLPYLKADNGVSDAVECDIVSEVCDIIHACATVMTNMAYREISETSVASDMLRITYRFGSFALNSSVRALSALANHPESTTNGVFAKQIMCIAGTFHAYLLKNIDLTNDFAKVNVKIRSNVHRALAVMGAMCRNHGCTVRETDTWMDEMKEELSIVDIPQEITLQKLIEACYRVFSIYLSKDDGETRCAALRALGGIFVARPRVLLAMEQCGGIAGLMSDDTMPDLQLQALRSWREILLAEENRIASGESKEKMEADARVTLSKKIQGDQDSDATLVGGILSQHAQRLFHLTACRNPLTRFAAVELLGHLLRQGLINPMQAVPFLFGLQGDVAAPNIRSFALKLLTIESEKRPEMIRQRVCAGIKQAYRFQRYVYPNREVTGVIQTQHGNKIVTECIFNCVFKDCIRNSTKNKTGLFRNLLSLFEIDEVIDTKKKGHNAVDNIPLLSFTSQVLAHLPYNTVSDPLFLIWSIQGMIAIQGQQLVDRTTTFLQDNGVPSVTVHDELNTEEDTLEIAAASQHPSRSKEASAMSKSDFPISCFVELCAQASAFILLLRLVTFFRRTYNLSEARCLEYSPDTKERNWDKISASPLFPKVFDSAIQNFFRQRKQTNEELFQPSNNRDIDKDALIKHYAEFRSLMRVEQSADIKLESGVDEDDKKRKLE